MSETAADVGGALTSHVGPLPAWGWAAIALAGYFAYEHFASGSNAATVADTADSGTADDTEADSTGDGSAYGDVADNSGDYGDYASGTNGDAGGVIYGTTGTGTVVTVYTTNQQWLIAAINALRAGGNSVGPATTALTLYLRGSKLTANEIRYVNAAIQLIGPPPNPLPIKGGGTATVAGTLAAPKVTLASKTKTSVRVTWTPVKGATSYQVNHDGRVIRSVTRGYTLRGLKSKSSHTISVRAAKGSTLGPPSNHLQVTTK